MLHSNQFNLNTQLKNKVTVLLHRDKLPLELLEYLERQKDIDFNQFEIPPPVFMAMKGEIISFDLNIKLFRCKFPVLGEQLNPYGVMQGGIISAAIDNTIGPLSMLVAPPSITRRIEVKYDKAIEKDIDAILVTAQFLEQKKRLLYFEANVKDIEESTQFASAKATHWII